MSLSQPLLWYRLFPSATYSTGVLLGITIATGSLVLLIAGLILARKWHLTSLQLLMISIALIGTFVVGSVVSTKIGGGNNLHNFDMYFITLVIVIMIYLDQGNTPSGAWPIWTRLLLVITILIPVFHALQEVSILDLPSQDIIEKSLQRIQRKVVRAADGGEVLFMDQRELLTFGYIENIDLIPEYEKKYMMDKAMAANEGYFGDLYEDLKNHRFEMIVSEPLHISYKNESDGFGEENNAWVKFVSEPILCYYKPDVTIKQVNIQLLVPREGYVDCDW